METSWKLTVEALGTAACELADSDLGPARPQTMLHALGRELLALAEPPSEPSARTAARGLLLIAERAVKVFEIAAMLDQAGVGHTGATIALAVALARTIAVGAQQRAQPLLSQLPDEELRANFEQELAGHVRQAEELAAQSSH